MIIHADMDAFYASIEIRENPRLSNKPLAVGGNPQGRGVISAANYIARRYGVHSALPSSQAVKRCPDLVLLPPNMSLYVKVSRQIHEIFARYTPEIEPLSLDEAFMDVSKSQRLFGSARQIAEQIKQDIKDELNLVVSMGIAPNKFLAKLASDLEKPDGFVLVNPAKVQEFLDPLPIKRIWGVGKRTQQALHSMGLYTIGDVRNYPLQLLEKRFGKMGQHIWLLAQGKDNRQVITQHQAKSISHEQTFADDLDDERVLLANLFQLCEQIAWRARYQNLKGRTVFIKIRDKDFHTISRRITLNQASDSTRRLWQAAKSLFIKEWSNKPRKVRLIGVGLGLLDDEAVQQEDLFNPLILDNKVDQVSDNINKRFGKGAVKRGTGLDPNAGVKEK